MKKAAKTKAPEAVHRMSYITADGFVGDFVFYDNGVASCVVKTPKLEEIETIETPYKQHKDAHEAFKAHAQKYKLSTEAPEGEI